MCDSVMKSVYEKDAVATVLESYSSAIHNEILCLV